MSPMENLDATVSVQAWGFQLKANDPADKRIDEFIKATRKNAGVEAGALLRRHHRDRHHPARPAAEQQQQTGG